MHSEIGDALLTPFRSIFPLFGQSASGCIEGTRMTRRKSPFSQFDLKRVLKAALDAGLEPSRVTITPAGSIEVAFGGEIEDELKETANGKEIIL